MTHVKGLKKNQSGTQVRSQRALRSATAARSRAVAPNVNLRASVTFRGAWAVEGATPEYGIYTVPVVEGGDFSLVGPLEDGYQYGCVDMGDGTLWGATGFTFYGMVFTTVDQYDTDTWTLTDSKEGSSASAWAFDTALDPTTGDVYGCFFNEDMSGVVWGKANYPEQTSTTLGTLNEILYGVGCSTAGQFYGMTQEGTLVKIDKETGATTPIGETGLATQYLTSGCVNNENNTFLYAVSTDAGGWLYEIDLATAEATLLTEFLDSEEIAGLYIAKPAAADKAPAVPKLSAVCDGGTMDVTLTLTMPETLYDGTPAPGQKFNYSIKAGDQEVASGFAVAGKTVVRTVTMTESGMTQFVATASNGDGVSPRAKASCYVGKGAPTAPANVTLQWADGTATLSWDAVTESADGGYLDPASVTYTVLSAAGEPVAEGLHTTTWSVSVAEPSDSYTLLSYSVKAVYDNKVSSATPSNTIGLGAYAAPLTMDLDDYAAEENFPRHTVVDANNDGKTWSVYYGSVRYSFNSQNAADDWLFSPAINLEAGKIYMFKAIAHAQGEKYPERIEVKAGQGALPTDMTLSVIEPTVVQGSSTTVTELSGMLKPTVSGRYNIGFHAISDADMNALTLVSYEIGSAMNPTAPAACSNIKISPSADGALKATIEFTMPKLNITGGNLTGDVSVKVLRNGETQVKTLTGKPGTTFSFADNVPAPEVYTYTFIPSNSAGEAGAPALASAYVGPLTPANPSEVSLTEIADNTLRLEWTPVTTDVDGNPLAPGNVVTYNVYSIVAEDGSLYYDEKLNSQPLEGTSFEYTIEPPQKQSMFYLGIQAVNGTVEGDVIAEGTLVGPPYDMPVVYTNMESLDSFLLTVGGTGSVSFANHELGVEAFDGDDSYIAIKHVNSQDALGTKTYISSGKILLSGDYPILSYYEYQVADASENETVVSVICDNQETVLKTYSSSELPVAGWNKVKVDLSAFRGKVVMVRLGAVLRTHLYNIYDLIEVKNNLANDLGVSIAAPAAVESDQKFDVMVTVSNEGATENGAATVDLLRNGEVIDSQNVSPIAPGSSVEFAFEQIIGKPDTSAEFSAVVNFASDQDETNNTSDVLTVERKKSTLPGITGLTGERGQEGIVLNWDAIDGDNLPVDPQTEDFESAESWAHEFEGWTFVDNDGVAVGGFQNLPLPGITSGTSTASFFIFDSAPDDFNATFAAHSGDKYLAALYRNDDGQTDDWAISPELSGDAQTVSFWASSYSDSYPETIEILCSSTDTDLESFTGVVSATKVPGEWTEFTADLPEGTKYFAIRSCATGSFMLMIDDVTFAAAGAASSLEHVGYNVYRDGVKINDAPLASNSYVDTEAGDAAHAYHVSAVYNRGESEFTTVTVDEAGISAVTLAGVSVVAENSEIIVTGAAANQVTVAAVDGKEIYSAVGDARIPVVSGIYLVTVGRNTVKLIVR